MARGRSVYCRSRRHQRGPAPLERARSRRLAGRHIPVTDGVHTSQGGGAMTTLCPSCGSWNMEGAEQCTDCGADLYNVDVPPPAVRIDQAVMRRPLSSRELTTIHSISPDETMDVAAQTLRRQKVDLLEVVESGRLIGVLSVRDIVARVGPDYRQKLTRTVREFMT